MEAVKKRSRPIAYERVTAVGLVVMALRPPATMVLDQRFQATGLIFVLIPLALLGLVLTRNRWLMIVIVGATTLLFLGGVVSPIVQSRLANPAATGYFILKLVDLLAHTVVIVSGFGALVQGLMMKH